MTTISDLVDQAAGQAGGKIAVAAAHDEDVLKAVCAAASQRIAVPILIGNRGKIISLLRELNEEANAFEIIDGETDEDCAAKAVACIVDNKANYLMKGLLSTADLMRAVLDREVGLRTERLISHIMLYEPAGHKMMALTDGGMNPFPDLAKKAEILENAAMTMRALGYQTIYAACVCGAEVVNPKIASMTDAVALCEMTGRWAPYHMKVYGPVGLDLAVSPEACRHKRYTAEGAGEADILLMPTYEVGNAAGKAMSIFDSAKNAGIIVGAKVPIVLVSRSDSAETKLASIAFGALVASSAL